MARIRFEFDPNMSDEQIVERIQAAHRRQAVTKIMRKQIIKPERPIDKSSKALERIRKSGFAPTINVVDAENPQNLVFGWANVAYTADGTQLLDNQGHMIDIEDLEHMAYNFTVKYRQSGDMHKSDAFGELVESMVFTPEKLEALGIPDASLPTAWWVGFRLPPEHAEAVRSGKRTMFSIEGTARLEPVS